MARCPFCGRMATQKNEQGLEVCPTHLQNVLEEIKCTCGRWLEQRTGKFGAYFHCSNCGNINFRKAMEMKEITTAPVSRQIESPKPASSSRTLKPERKETVITSRDVEFFD